MSWPCGGMAVIFVCNAPLVLPLMLFFSNRADMHCQKTDGGLTNRVTTIITHT